MKDEFVVLALWAVAVFTTAVVVGDTGKFTYLGPLYAICAIGSVVTVRRARSGGGR